MKKNTIFIIIAILLLIIDRISKLIFQNKDFFIINYTENTGALFGMFKNSTTFLITISIILLIALIYYFYISDFKNKIPLLLIILGLFSNLIDRFVHGFVIDFIDFKFWPVFNLADAFIVIGTIYLFIILIRK